MSIDEKLGPEFPARHRVLVEHWLDRPSKNRLNFPSRRAEPNASPPEIGRLGLDQSHSRPRRARPKCHRHRSGDHDHEDQQPTNAATDPERPGVSGKPAGRSPLRRDVGRPAAIDNSAHALSATIRTKAAIDTAAESQANALSTH